MSKHHFTFTKPLLERLQEQHRACSEVTGNDDHYSIYGEAADRIAELEAGLTEIKEEADEFGAGFVWIAARAKLLLEKVAK